MRARPPHRRYLKFLALSRTTSVRRASGGGSSGAPWHCAAWGGPSRAATAAARAAPARSPNRQARIARHNNCEACSFHRLVVLVVIVALPWIGSGKCASFHSLFIACFGKGSLHCTDTNES